MVAPRIVTLPVEPVTEKAFAPYGTVLGPREEPQFGVDLEQFTVDAWIHDTLDMTGGLVEVQTFTLTVREPEMRYIERHEAETQAFAPLGDFSYVFAVAAPTDGEGPEHCPEPETVRAFLCNGTQGLKLNRGVWHWVPFPVGQATGTFLNLTRAGKFGDVMEGSEEGSSRGDFQRRDLEELRGVRFRFDV